MDILLWPLAVILWAIAAIIGMIAVAISLGVALGVLLLICGAALIMFEIVSHYSERCWSWLRKK